MNLPRWNLSRDPGYLRVRGMILRFFTSLSGRLYIDGRLTEDQKDDVQDAFEVYFRKVYRKTRIENREEVVLYLAIRTILDSRKKSSKVRIGGTEVPRQKVSIR